MSLGIQMYWRYPISHLILCHQGSTCTGDTPSHTWYYVTGDPHVLEIPHLTPDTMSPGSTCTGDTPTHTWYYVTRDPHVLEITHLTPNTMSPGSTCTGDTPSHTWYYVTRDPHVLEIPHLTLDTMSPGSTCTGDTPTHTWYYVTRDPHVLEIPHLTHDTMSPGIHMYWRYPISHLILCHRDPHVLVIPHLTPDAMSPGIHMYWRYPISHLILCHRDPHVLEIPHLTPGTMAPGIDMYWRYPISHLVLWHLGLTCTGYTPSHTWYYGTRDWHVLEIPHLTPGTMAPGIHMYWRYPISHLILCHQGLTCTGDTPSHTWYYVTGDPHVLKIPHLTPGTMAPGIDMYWRYPISHLILCHQGLTCTGDTPSHTWYYGTRDPHVLEIPHLTPGTMAPGIHMYWRYPISHLVLWHQGSTCTGDTPSHTWYYVTRDWHVLVIPHLIPDTMSPGIYMYWRYPISHLILKDLSMMYRALWDRRHEGATRISQCTRRVAPSALTYSSGPWVPPISQCTIHHA